MTEEIEYTYVKGQGWVAGYRRDPWRQMLKAINFGMPTIPIPRVPNDPRDEARWMQLIGRLQRR